MHVTQPHTISPWQALDFLMDDHWEVRMIQFLTMFIYIIASTVILYIGSFCFCFQCRYSFPCWLHLNSSVYSLLAPWTPSPRMWNTQCWQRSGCFNLFHDIHKTSFSISLGDPDTYFGSASMSKFGYGFGCFRMTSPLTRRFRFSSSAFRLHLFCIAMNHIPKQYLPSIEKPNYILPLWIAWSLYLDLKIRHRLWSVALRQTQGLTMLQLLSIPSLRFGELLACPAGWLFVIGNT